MRKNCDRVTKMFFYMNFNEVFFFFFFLRIEGQRKMQLYPKKCKKKMKGFGRTFGEGAGGVSTKCSSTLFHSIEEFFVADVPSTYII